ncbi:MAG: sulfite exporter TauE/SafE family protein [Acetobacteraceae bacterium]
MSLAPTRSNSLDPLIAIVAVGAAVGGFVQGLSGFAFGLTAMAIWAWSIDPLLAGPLVVFGTLVGQLLSIGSVRRGLDAGLIWPFLAGGVLGVPLGVALLRYVDPLAFRMGVGVLLLLWCPAMLLARDLPRVTRGGRLADAAVGWIGGIMCGLGGLNGPAPTLWTTLRGWDRDRQRAVFQVFSLVTQALTMATYLAAGTVPAGAARLFAVAAPAMLLPTLLGARLYRRFSDAMFRRIVLGLLTLSGAILVATTVPRLL